LPDRAGISIGRKLRDGGNATSVTMSAERTASDASASRMAPDDALFTAETPF
jgi:hypothetical protein